MVSKRYTRKKTGGKNWNCECTLASNPGTKTVIAVPVKKAAAVTTLQQAVRQRQATQKLKGLKSASKSPTISTATPAGLKSALATQSASMSPQQKGMEKLMAKPGMTEAKAKAILSSQSKKKAIATKIQSRSDSAISTTGAKKQAKRTAKKATKAQKKKSSSGGRKHKTRRLKSKRR